jgi:hypothetical protein
VLSVNITASIFAEKKVPLNYYCFEYSTKLCYQNFLFNPSSGILNAKRHLNLLLWHDEYRRYCHLKGLACIFHENIISEYPSRAVMYKGGSMEEETIGRGGNCQIAPLNFQWMFH